MDLAMDPTGRNLLATQAFEGRAFLIPLDGGTPQTVPRITASWLNQASLSGDGRLAAVGTRQGPHGNQVEVWDLNSGEIRMLDSRVGDESCGWGEGFEGVVWSTKFTSDGRLLTAGVAGLRLWDLEKGTNILLRPCRNDAATATLLAASLVDRFLLAEINVRQKTSAVSVHDVRSDSSHELISHGNRVSAVALDPSGEIVVTGDYDGVVRAGPITREEPHLLYGHELEISSLAVSPDGRWIASGSQDGTIRLWPMPEGQPFHTRSYEEILQRIRTLTNVRVIADGASETGYRVEVGPFPGWKTVPVW